MSSVKFPNKCYIMLRNLDESGRKTWASNVKEQLFRNVFGYVQVVEYVGDKTLFIKNAQAEVC